MLVIVFEERNGEKKGVMKLVNWKGKWWEWKMISVKNRSVGKINILGWRKK